jgi:hypothetical protein
MYADLISLRKPPEKRRRYRGGPHERVFSEGAVMLAFAMYLFENEKGVEHVRIYPDGMHDTETFRFRPWLERHGFVKHSTDAGRTKYAGEYRDGKRTVTISVNSGHGDVVAVGAAGTIIAECKGGCINTSHPGQKSHQTQRLYAAVGHLIAHDRGEGRHVAVVPDTPVTRSLAAKMAKRARQIGIEIALVGENGISFFT